MDLLKNGEALIAAAKEKAITGINANTGAIVDNVTLIYNDNSSSQLGGGNGGTPNTVSKLASDEYLISVCYVPTAFSGKPCIGKVVFETNKGQKISFNGYSYNSQRDDAKAVKISAKKGELIISLKGTAAGAYLSTIDIDKSIGINNLFK